jgi:hypothetical protein
MFFSGDELKTLGTVVLFMINDISIVCDRHKIQEFVMDMDAKRNAKSFELKFGFSQKTFFQQQHPIFGSALFKR